MPAARDQMAPLVSDECEIQEEARSVLPSWVLRTVIEWSKQGLSGQLTLNYHRGTIGTLELKRRLIADDFLT
jgi:hypothetical protein